MSPPITPAIVFFNHLLQQEPWAQQRMRQHAQRLIMCRIPGWSLEWGVRITETGLLESTTQEHSDADVTLRLHDDLFAHVLQHGLSAARQKIHLAGDADLAATLAEVLQNLRWDVEHDASRLLGDALAHRLARSARSTAQQLGDTHTRLRDSLLEYLTEERPLLVKRTHLDDQRAQLHALRDQVARLEKRLASLPPTPSVSTKPA